MYWLDFKGGRILIKRPSGELLFTLNRNERIMANLIVKRLNDPSLIDPQEGEDAEAA